MQKRGIFIYLLAGLSMLVGAQHLSNQVLVPVASVSTNSGYSISQTIGEVAVQYIHDDSFGLTQGFQQPSISVLEPVVPLGNGVKIYPNPVVNNLTLEFFGSESTEYHLTIFGINGSIYYKNDYPCIGKFWHKIQIDVGHYQRGTYFIRIVAVNGSISRLFKIEKI